MHFSELASFFHTIENTSSRNEMTKILAELFKKLHEDEIDKVIYLLQGRIAPTYVKIDFGLGEKLVIKAITRALNIEHKHFMNRYKSKGDIGEAAEFFKKEIRSIGERDMTVKEVFVILEKITKASGGGSQDTKLALLAELIQTIDSLSTRYLVRIPINTLRLGFSDMTILDSLSWMLDGNKSHRPIIERAYQIRTDLGYIGKTVKQGGVHKLEKVKPEVFTPILMMKAQRLPTPQEIIDKIGKGIVEPKYDGFRLQVHYKNKKVKLFSRNLDDVTYMYPDIIEGIRKEVKAKEIIFEGEAIGFDPHSGSFLPFQETVQRKRKYHIQEKALEIPLKMFAFELLFLNGNDYINKPFEQRRKALEKQIKLSGDIFKDTLLLSPEKIADNDQILEEEFDDAISRGLEGIMIKKIDGVYQPGARGWNWIKYKRSQSSKIDDSIDCLVMGYDVGKGKRSGFGIGAFLAGVYDDKHDIYRTIAKIGTGLSDIEWVELRKRCDHIASNQRPALYEVDKQMNVDVWVKPKIVVEIQADEITRSSVHTAGRVMQATKSGKGSEVKASGYALRFPRLKRFRDDKKPEQATTLSELKQMYKDSKQ